MTTQKPISAERHVVVDASAGTGKTYTLSSRMIRALLDRADADPAGVLATTFTRKAAGDITRRVFERLLETAHDPAKLDALRHETGRPALTAADCADAAAALARRMDRLRISTIDAMMQRMARAGSMELATAPGWRIGEQRELADIRASAIDAALSQGDADQTARLLRALSRNPLSRSIHRALERAVEEAHSVYAACWDRERDDTALAAMWQVVAAAATPLDPLALRAALDRLARAPVPGAATDTPNGHFLRAVDALVRRAHDADWEGIVAEGLGVKVILDQPYYRKPIEGPLRSAVAELVAHAASILLARLADRNRATAALVGRYDRIAREARYATGILEFDDVPRLLVEADVAGRLSELWYRLDASIDHILIDEAQDTSIMQFRMMRPVLDELIAGGDCPRGILIVGDPKQSLYAWRQAEAELLPAIPRVWEGRFAERTLAVSYRSSQIVLDAVNSVFARLHHNDALKDRDGALDAAQRFSDRFIPHKAAKQLPGLVRVRTHPWLETAEGQRPKADRITGTVQAVQQLLEEAKGRHLEIGVLVRKNKPIPRVVNALRAAGIDASQEGGGSLDEDPAVSAVLSLLWWADHPTDSMALFHAATGPVGAAVGWQGIPPEAQARRQAATLRRMLVTRGYAAVLARLARKLEGRLTDASQQRLDQLIELARAFDQRASLRPGEFVQLVCDTRVERPGGAAVRVMTIHKAKGLEFDAVVLPSLDDIWASRPGGAMFERDHALAAATGASLAVSREVARLHPRLAAMVRRRDDRQTFEELCGLYVAMTRAKRALVMLVDPYKKPKDALPFKASGILRGSLIDVQESNEGGQVIWHKGHANWWEELPLLSQHSFPSTPEAAHQSAVPITLAPSRGSLRRAPIVAPSSMEGAGRIDLGRRMSLDSAGGRDVGTAVHAMLALVHWLDDAPPTPSALESAARAAGADDRTTSTALDLVHRTLTTNAAQVLRRAWHTPTPHTTLDLRNEWQFLHEDLTNDQPRLISGVIDRLVLSRRSGAVVAADVIDYKTDTIASDADLAARVAHYTPQLNAYCRAVQHMFPAATVRGLLMFVGPGAIVPV